MMYDDTLQDENMRKIWLSLQAQNDHRLDITNFFIIENRSYKVSYESLENFKNNLAK